MAPAYVQGFQANREARAKASKPAALKRAVAQAVAYESGGATPPGWDVPYVSDADIAARKGKVRKSARGRGRT